MRYDKLCPKQPAVSDATWANIAPLVEPLYSPPVKRKRGRKREFTPQDKFEGLLEWLVSEEPWGKFAIPDRPGATTIRDFWRDLHEEGVWYRVWLEFARSLSHKELEQWCIAVSHLNSQHTVRLNQRGSRGWQGVAYRTATFVLLIFVVVKGAHKNLIKKGLLREEDLFYLALAEETLAAAIPNSNKRPNTTSRSAPRKKKPGQTKGGVDSKSATIEIPRPRSNRPRTHNKKKKRKKTAVAKRGR